MVVTSPPSVRISQRGAAEIMSSAQGSGVYFSTIKQIPDWNNLKVGTVVDLDGLSKSTDFGLKGQRSASSFHNYVEMW